MVKCVGVAAQCRDKLIILIANSYPTNHVPTIRDANLNTAMSAILANDLEAEMVLK